ncbi:MAG: NAD(P)H-dependent oxidoreductase [Pseudomonadota bacterium]
MNILVFAGSVRRESLNRRLARVAAQAVDGAGGKATLLELADFPLPLYDGDLEAESGPPDNAFRLQEVMGAHDGFIVVSPEYNHSISALLKNTLDWVSRTPRVRGANPFAGKVAGLMATSPGALGGLQGLDTVQQVLSTVGALVLPRRVAVPHGDKAFDGTGRLLDESSTRRVAELASEVVAIAGKLAG